MTETLGEDYERELSNEMLAGELSHDEYQRRVQPLTECREWEHGLQIEYQRDWRADMARWFDWAKDSRRMERQDYLALLVVERPDSPDDFQALAASLERIAGAL